MAAPPTSFRRDLVAGYTSSFTKVASWAAVSAIVYRQLGAEAFATLVLVRGTLGILNHTTVGVAPALLRAVTQADRAYGADRVTPNAGVPPRPDVVLDYAHPDDGAIDPAAVPIYNANRLAAGAAVLALCISFLAAILGPMVLDVPASVAADFFGFTLVLGLGITMRIASDVPAAVLHARRRYWLDALFLAAADVAWVAGVAVFANSLEGVAAMFALSSFGLFVARRFTFNLLTQTAGLAARHRDWPTMLSLLAFGGWVTLANLADYLYAPIDYIILNRLVGPLAVAAYGPAVQIDAALLLLVTGLATVLLPYAARASAFGDVAALRRQYVRGTLASAGLLLACATVTWLAAPWLLRAWLGEVPPGTLAILPLVLVHTVVGGSSAVGRSVLIGMGHVRALAVSVLVAGAANVGLSVALAYPLGLRGVVLATVIVVTLRCAVWMPWYVLRQLRA